MPSPHSGAPLSREHAPRIPRSTAVGWPRCGVAHRRAVGRPQGDGPASDPSRARFSESLESRAWRPRPCARRRCCRSGRPTPTQLPARRSQTSPLRSRIVDCGGSAPDVPKPRREPGPERVSHDQACKAPCNRSTGIAFPVADGPRSFDSGQLGFNYAGFNAPAAERDTWSTPKNLPAGTNTYFCRVHPFMRGSFRVVGGG